MAFTPQERQKLRTLVALAGFEEMLQQDKDQRQGIPPRPDSIAFYEGILDKLREEELRIEGKEMIESISRATDTAIEVCNRLAKAGVPEPILTNLVIAAFHTEMSTAQMPLGMPILGARNATWRFDETGKS